MEYKIKQKGSTKRLPFSQIIREDKKTFIVYIILHVIIASIMVYSAIVGHWSNIFPGFLSIVLLLIPAAVEHSFHIKLPATLEVLAYLFVFASSILGEVGDFYRIVPFWDSFLHLFNGFMFAAFGFCLVDIFNKDKHFRFVLSPFFLTFLAFCFSMTVGVLWEFFEYAADTFLLKDMQKDVLLNTIHSVSIPNDVGEKVTHVTGITSTVITTQSGEQIVLNGFLDIGLADTMKDMMLNCVGAIIFSIIGYFYVKRRGKGHFARQFIPVHRDCLHDAHHPAPESTEQPTDTKHF